MALTLKLIQSLIQLADQNPGLPDSDLTTQTFAAKNL
jgi:hypothetical protein